MKAVANETASKMDNIVWHDHAVSNEERGGLKSQRPAVLWFTGLSGSGKSTVANAVERKLLALNKHSYLLDGDNVRHGLNKDLTFTDADRIENIRRIGEVAKLFVDSGLLVLTAFISPFISDRKQVRDQVADKLFIEIFIDTPISVCESRDPKGLYKKARAGEIKHFTGIDSDYEIPPNPEIHVHTARYSVEECADQIINYLNKNGYLNV
jgi:adenylylsulfate kinase